MQRPANAFNDAGIALAQTMGMEDVQDMTSTRHIVRIDERGRFTRAKNAALIELVPKTEKTPTVNQIVILLKAFDGAKLYTISG